jgi:hypothetical protein
MDAATFDRFLVLLDKHWASPQRIKKTAIELNAWREAEARRKGDMGMPLRLITAKNLSDLCGKALNRLSIA